MRLLQVSSLPRNIRFAFGCVLLATVVIPVVYLKSSVDAGLLWASINTTLEEIRREERALSESLLLTRMGRVGHYDDVVAHQVALRATTGELNELLATQGDHFTADLASLELAVTRKFREVEHVKSHNAVLRNSLHYLPVATKELQTLLLKGGRAHLEAAQAAGLLLDELLMVGLDNDGVHQQRARELIEQLDELQPVNPALTDALDGVLSHARVFLVFHSDLEQAMSALLDWSVATRVNAVESAFDDWRQEQVAEAGSYRLILVVMAVVLALSVLFSILLLARYSRRLSESLKDKEFQEFALNQHAIVSMTDARGVINYVNDKFCEISGFDREDLMGTSHRILKTGEHSPEFFESLWKTISAGKVWHGEIKNRKKNGGFYWVASTIVPFTDAQGKPFRYVSIRTDISARKRYEAELEQARAVADKAASAKGNFLANMSHEIRTPMNAIIGMSHLVLASELNPQQRSYVADIHRAAEGLLGIINDILDFSKIEAGKLVVEQRRFDLGELLAQVQVLVVELAKDTPVEFLVDMPTALPGWVVGDELRLQQVLVNLLSNAVKFTNDGEVILRVAYLTRDDGRIELQFEVSDTGIGISPEQISLLFTAFNQADASTSRKFGGTGLGLAICQQLVQLLGGELRVSSELGEGSRFSFAIPVALADAASEPAKGPRSGRLQGLGALYIDDSVEACKIAQHLAADLGLAMTSLPDVASVERALDGGELQGKKLDLVLFDWGLGEAAFRQVRQTVESLRPFDACRFIAVSPQRSQKIHEEIARAKADACSHKPLSSNSLFKACNNALGEQSPVAEVSEQSARWGKVPDLTDVTLLVVEDNPVNQHVLSGFLAHTHATVQLAGTGLEALAWLDEHAADLVLMDVQMPGLDGYETARRLRRDTRFARLPIVAVTANAMAGDRERARNAGMNDYLPKPIDPETLFRTLMKWLPVGNSEVALTVPALPAADAVDYSEELELLKGFDLDRVLPNLGSDEAIFREVLAVFAANHSEEIQTLDGIKRSGNQDALGKRAHALKGVLSSVGAYEASDAARDLEFAIRGEIDSDPEDCYWRLINALEPVLSSVGRYFAVADESVNPDVTPHESQSASGS